MSVKSGETKAVPETIVEDDPLEAEIDHLKTPRCSYHSDREAISVCDICERKICEKDMVKSGTVEICNKCFSTTAEDAKFGIPFSYVLGSLPIFVIVAVFLLMKYL